MTQSNTIPLKIVVPELEKEFSLSFPRTCTIFQMFDIIYQTGVITDRNFLNECHFFIPWSGIWMQKSRTLESYALCDEEPLEMWNKPHFPDTFLTVFIPDLNVRENIPFFPKFTTGRGAIQSLEAKDKLNIEFYGLYDPEKDLWIEINECLSNYGFETGGYVEYIKYSKEEAEVRKQEFLKSKGALSQTPGSNLGDSGFPKRSESSPRQKAQPPNQSTQPQPIYQSTQPQPIYQSTQPQPIYQSTQPQQQLPDNSPKFQRSSVALQVKAPFLPSPVTLSFSTSDNATNVISRIKWYGNLQNDTTGYDVVVHYKDGSSNVMDEISPLYFYETNMGGNPYTLIELLPNNTTIPPPQAPQPLDLKTIPSTGVNQPNGNEASNVPNLSAPKGMTATASGSVSSQSTTNPSTLSQSAITIPTSASANDLTAFKKGGSTTPITVTNKSPSLASIPVDSITIKVEIPAIDQAKSIKVSWSETPTQIIQTLKSKKWLPIELSSGFCLCIPGNEKVKPKLRPVMMEPNQPISTYRDRIKPLDTILLITEEEGKKMLTKKGYTPTGALSKVHKEKKLSVFHKFRKSESNQKRDEKKRGSEGLAATVAVPNYSGKTGSSPSYSPLPAKEPSPSVTINYRYEVLKKLVEALEERGTKEEGIFRVSGSTDTTNQVYATLNDVPDVSKMKVHDIASVLRKYLRELPDPLIPFSKYDLFADTQKQPTPEEKNKALKNAIGTLPEENKSGLKLLIRLLKKIADNSDVTKMNSSNLAVIFGPALLRTKGEQAIQSPQTPTNIVNSLISNYNFFFESPPTDSSTQLRIDLLKSSDLLDLGGANFSPKQDASQSNNTVSNVNSGRSNYDQVIASLLSPTSTNVEKAQNVAKLSNFFHSENEQLKQHFRDKVGIENAIKLVEVLANLCTTTKPPQ